LDKARLLLVSVVVLSGCVVRLVAISSVVGAVSSLDVKTPLLVVISPGAAAAAAGAG